MSTTRPSAQPDYVLRNDTTSIPSDWQGLAHITTGRERLKLMQTVLPYSYDPDRVAEIQNSMSLLSITSSHWALKLLIYLASNKLSQRRDIDHMWRLVEETGIKKLANFSKFLHLGETSLKAALEFLFEAGICFDRTDIVSWLLDIGIDANNRIMSQHMQGSHLPLNMIMLDRTSWRPTGHTSMVRLLLSKGALTLVPCCERHNTATHLAMMKFGADAEILELFLQAGRRAQSHQMSSQHLKSVFQEDGTNNDDYEAHENRDTLSVILELLVDMVDKLLDEEFPLLTTLVCPETLIEAVKFNNHRLMRIIRSRGLSMDCCDANQESPLVEGLKLVGFGVKVSTIELLLELGASPNYEPCPNSKNLCSSALQTAMKYCPFESQAEVVGILLRNGATIRGSVSCLQSDHQNVTHCVIRGNTSDRIDPDVFILLHDAGLISLLDYMECIHAWYLRGKYDPSKDVKRVLRTLISETTDMSLQSEIGWTALDYALNLEMKEAGELMLEKGAMQSHKFIHDHCLSGCFKFEELETLFTSVPFPQTDKQKRNFLFYRIIGTLRAEDLRGDALVRGVQDLVKDYRKLPRSQKHEAYIIRQACVKQNVYLVGLVLELFPNTYSPAALEELIRFQTEKGVDNWKFIEELLQRRMNASSPLNRRQDIRIFMHAFYDALICKGNSKVLEWFHENNQEAFELANSGASAFLMNIIHSSARWSTYSWRVVGGLKRLNMNQLYEHGLKTSSYLGLVAVLSGRVDQISDLLNHGLRPNRRFAWSFTILQLAVAIQDLPMSRRLLEAGADVDGRPPWRDTPWSIKLHIPYEFFEMLNTGYYEGYSKRRSALQLAVEQGNVSMIRLLLENGADLNGPPARVGGATALQIACMKGYIDLTKLLIERGADVNGAGAEYFGRTALEGAAEHGRLDTVSLLLQSGCRIHGSLRRQYIRAVGFARAQAHHTVAKKLQDSGEWTNVDEFVLRSTNLRDIKPKCRDLEEEWQDHEDVSEVDSEDLELEELDPFPFEPFEEMDSDSEFGDCSLTRDAEAAISSGQGTPKGVLDECSVSERDAELQTVRLDTWDDLLEYYGDDEGV